MSGYLLRVVLGCAQKPVNCSIATYQEIKKNVNFGVSKLVGFTFII